MIVPYHGYVHVTTLILHHLNAVKFYEVSSPRTMHRWNEWSWYTLTPVVDRQCIQTLTKSLISYSSLSQYN